MFLLFSLNEMLAASVVSGRSKEGILEDLARNSLPSTMVAGGLISKPTAFFDENDVLVALYLPGAFTSKRCVRKPPPTSPTKY